MDAEMFIRHEAIRSEIYKLLAESYYPPNEALPDNILDLIEKLELVGLQDINWGGEEILKADSIEDLTVEHARLFVGPYTLLAPPYGSVYMEPERRIMGNSTMDVVKRYQQSGLDMAGDFKDAPDHIAAELEFMHFLYSAEAECMQGNEREKELGGVILKNHFLTTCLAPWIHPFCQNIKNATTNQFYINLAECLEIVIAQVCAPDSTTFTKQSLIQKENAYQPSV